MNSPINFSNALTLFRIALLIPMGWLMQKDFNFAAMCVLILAAISDGLDGYFARKLNQVSDFGKVIDPIADKIFLSVSLYLLVGDPLRQLNPWIASIIVAREFFVSGLRSLFASKNIILSAEKTAKWKTAFQFIGIGAYLLKDPLLSFMPSSIIIGKISFLVAIILSYLSMFHYIKKYLYLK
jgi:CDP-diacylglycerol--glycerol-3-phosphate 3-phosphatidyltransferase